MTRLPALLLLFFLSGAAGLLYQVVWTRMFVHVFGATVLAVSTVLAAFMAGLAMGGLWAGRAVARIRRPLRLYGILEVALGIYAALIPGVLRILEPLYARFYPALEGSFGTLSAIRFVASAIVLLPPTFLMGATLPLLTEHVERGGAPARRRVARLYAINTFGAVAGTVASAFFLLPGIGLARTLGAGVTVSLAVGVGAILLARKTEGAGAMRPGAAPAPPASATPADAAADIPLLPRPLVLLTTAILGFSALAFEVLWTRTLTLSLGTTTYAFAIVLAVFLIGIAAGGLVAERLLANARRALAFFVAAPATIGLASLLLLPVFDRLPGLFVLLTTRGGGGWVEGLLVKFVIAGLPLLLPTLASGAAFPLAVGIDRSTERAGRSAGDIYGANTIGAILGSWGAGFVLIPAWGLRNGIAFAAALPILATCVLLLSGRLSTRRSAGIAALVAAAGALVFVALPDWNRGALTRGAFAVEVVLRRSGRTSLARDLADLVFLEEGLTSTVTVRRWRDELTMQINGVTEASNTGDMATQVMLGGLPVLLHEAPRDVLVIGLGSGITATAAGRSPAVESLECVEISEAVVDAARLFAKENEGILGDPRFRLILGDGRNHLRLGGRDYDCIISQPSNVWNAGIGSLMSREFYALCREHLRPGGILCSFIQGYSLTPDALRSVLAAASESFPVVTLWSAAWGDLLVIAGDERFALDVRRILERAKESAFLPTIRQMETPDLVTLLSSVLLAGDFVTHYVDGFPPNTDDDLYLEFESPKFIHRETIPDLFTNLHRAAGGTESVLRGASPAFVEELVRAREARALESRARIAFTAERGEEGLTAAEEAYRLLPSAPPIRRLLAQALSSRGLALANRGDPAAAARDFVRATDIDPESGEALANLASLYRDAGQLVPAREAVDEALRRQPRRPEFLALSAELSNRMREYGEARAAAEAALAIDRTLLPGYVSLGDALAGGGNTAAADSVWSAGLARHPESEEIRSRLRARKPGRSAVPRAG